MPVRRPVHVGPLAGGADGVAEALRLAPHPPQAAAGEQALHRELHGDAHREVDELTLSRESGECPGICKFDSVTFANHEVWSFVNKVTLLVQPSAGKKQLEVLRSTRMLI